MSVITLDLFELAAEWEEAVAVLGSLDEIDDDERAEARELDERCKQLCADLNLEPANEPSTLRWGSVNQGITLIREDTFTDYAREFAEDLHGNDEASLMAYVDWDRYADSLRIDYSELTYDGHEWLRRA